MKPAMVSSGLFEPASSRLKFDKDASEIRMLYKTITNTENNQKLNQTATNFYANPLAVTNGAEFVKD